MTTVTTPVSPSTSVEVAPSAYAKYCADKQVTGVALYLPTALVEMMGAARPGVKATQVAREAVIALVNGAGLTRPVYIETVHGEDRVETPWIWEDPKPAKKLTAAEKEVADAKAAADKARLELELLKEEMAALKASMPAPTPPTVKADAKTGKTVAA